MTTAKPPTLGPFKMVRNALLMSLHRTYPDSPQRMVLHPDFFMALCADMPPFQATIDRCELPAGASMRFMGVPIYEDRRASEPHLIDARGNLEPI